MEAWNATSPNKLQHGLRMGSLDISKGMWFRMFELPGSWFELKYSAVLVVYFFRGSACDIDIAAKH